MDATPVILHLVTDRRRLMPGGGPSGDFECLLSQARFAAEAGIDVIQVREPDLDARQMASLVAALVAATRHTTTRILVNDRLDVALASRAAGVHLRADSPDAAVVRRHVPEGFVIGRSVHTVAEAAAAGPVDYLIAGTVWPTPSKSDDHPLLGVDGLTQVCAVARVPVLAIGGFGAGRAGQVRRAGAAGGAGIGIFMASSAGAAGACRAVPLGVVAARLRQAFDRAGSPS